MDFWFVLVPSETFGRNPILFQFLLNDSELLFQFQSHFELIFPFDFDEQFSNNIIYHLTCTYNGFNSHVLIPAKNSNSLESGVNPFLNRSDNSSKSASNLLDSECEKIAKKCAK